MSGGALQDVVAQVRVARPTAALRPMEAFYRERIGLAPVSSFAGHAGFDGAILATAPNGAHFELTQGPAHADPPARRLRSRQSPRPEPTTGRRSRCGRARPEVPHR